MARTITEDVETKQRRVEALARIQRFQEEISARNSDLTFEEAEAIAEELSLAAIESIIERNALASKRNSS